MYLRTLHSFIFLTLISTASMAKNNITIYSNQLKGQVPTQNLTHVGQIPGFAIIRQSRTLPFEKGEMDLDFTSVAAHIDPTTVALKHDQKQGAFSLIDQNFHFDLVNQEKLLHKFIDQTITVQHQDNKTSSGQLLSANDGLVLQQDNGRILAIKNWQNITFPKLPEGLLTKPTLQWHLQSNVSGNQPVTVSYQTQGMTWWSDYNITLNEDEGDRCLMDLSSWLTLVNHSGATFKDSQIKLVAGDVNVAQPNPRHHKAMATHMMQEVGHIQSKELFEYHIYQLPRRVDLPDASTKQVPLLNTSSISCNKKLELQGPGHNISPRNPIKQGDMYRRHEYKVEARLAFENKDKNGLGIPMPAGRIRVNMLNPEDDSLELIGEDFIDHTPKNERIDLLLGHAFDVTAIRKQMSYRDNKTQATESISITVNNAKSHPVTVTVKEFMYRWTNWQIDQASHDHKKSDAQTVTFQVTIPAESSETLDYQVTYLWPN